MLDYNASLNSTRVGRSPEAEQELLAMLQTVEHYSKMASKPGVSIVCRNKPMGPRTVRCFCLELGTQCVPVLKSKLSAKPTKAKPCKHCNKGNCSRKQSLGIMRWLIAPQIEAFKESHAKAIAKATKHVACGHIDARHELNRLTHCPLSGKSLMGLTHVDHKAPFSKLVLQWAEEFSVDLCKQKFSGKGQTKIFANGELNESWQHWHEKNAELQIVCAKANLQKGAKLSY